MACPEATGCWGKAGSWDTSIGEEGRWRGSARLPHNPGARMRSWSQAQEEAGNGMPPECQRLMISCGRGAHRSRLGTGGVSPFLSQFPAPLSHCPPNLPSQQSQKLRSPSPQQWEKPDVPHGWLPPLEARDSGHWRASVCLIYTVPSPLHSFLCPLSPLLPSPF